MEQPGGLDAATTMQERLRDMMDNKKRHKEVAQGGNVGKNLDGRQCFRRDELYRIPAPLMAEIAGALEQHFI